MINEHRTKKDPSQSGGSQLRDALDCIGQTVLDGLHHGFFRCTISIEKVRDGRRELLIEAGKTHKYTIPEDELR